jgi:hypothetical protein
MAPSLAGGWEAGWQTEPPARVSWHAVSRLLQEGWLAGWLAGLKKKQGTTAEGGGLIAI